MVFTLYVFSILINFFKNKSKYVFIVTTVFLWIVVGWCYSNADTEVYRFRYTYDLISTEILFQKIIALSRKVALSFEEYRIILSGIFSLIIFYVIYKNSYNYNFALALYIVFPFCFNAVQLRQFTANAVILLALFILKKKEREGVFVYLLLTIIATLLHSSALFFAIFILTVYLDIKQSAMVSLIISATTYLLLSKGIFAKILELLGLNGRSRSIIEAYSNILFSQKVYYVLCILLGLMGCFALILYQRLLCNYDDKFQKSELDFNIKCHLFTLVCIPLIFSGIIDCIRYQFALLPMTFCLFSYSCPSYFNGQKGKVNIKKKELLFSVCCVMYTFVLLYIWILNNGNRETVFMSLMNNNLLIGR